MLESDFQKEILPFFYPNNLPKSTALDYREFEIDGYKVFALASLYSEKIETLESNLDFALDSLISSFHESDGEILDRMKNAIFSSGDKLADYLMGEKLPVDDVDYNVCLIAFFNGIAYVWVDGDLGVRIYRGKESLLVNSRGVPQFFGSSNVETGDIFALSLQNYLKDNDLAAEDYVLENSTPDYPGLFIDYQMEVNKIASAYEASPRENILKPTGFAAEDIEIEEPGHIRTNAALMPEEAPKRQPISTEKMGEMRDKAVDSFNKIKESGIFGKIIDYIKIGLTSIWNGLMWLTSAILDFVFGIFYGKNQYQFKRFQTSLRKKNMQYVLLLLIFMLIGYFAFFRPAGQPGTQNNGGFLSSGGNVNGLDNNAVRNNLQAAYDELKAFSASSDIPNFNSSYEKLTGLLNQARDSGFNDTAFLNTVTIDSQNLRYVLYKITPVSKIDEAFLADNIPNAQIVDFSVIGNDVYALDKANSQVLKSNSSTQKLEVFASDANFTGLNQISCSGKVCYIMDDAQGLGTLNIETKTFNKFTALKNAGVGVKELATYSVRNTLYVYAFVPDQGKIIRYTKAGEGFSAGETWNKASGFGAAIEDIAIDGGIFEISTEGNLRRFFGGTAESASAFGGLGALMTPLGTDLQIATTPSRNTAPGVINRFYVADPLNRRVAVFEKDLNQSKQYTFKGSFEYSGGDKVNFTEFKEIVLSDDEKTLYGLGNNIVFRFSVSAI
jgi:hypothetical protein